MEFYFTKNDNESYFLVVINNLNIEIIRISSNNKNIWSGDVENVFIGEHHLIDDINIEEAKGNSILLHLHSNNQYYKYMFLGSSIYTFETTDKIV